MRKIRYRKDRVYVIVCKDPNFERKTLEFEMRVYRKSGKIEKIYD